MKNWLQIITLIFCLLLLVIVIAQGNQLERYQQSLDDRMNMLQSHLTAEIDAVSDRVEAALEEQQRLVSDFSLEPLGIDVEKKALSAQVCVTLKEYAQDMQVTLIAGIAGESLAVPMESDGAGTYTAELLLPLEAGRELILDVRILFDGRTRQEELGAWGDLSMLLPLRSSGGGWSGPVYFDGALESQFHISIEGREGKTVSVQEPQFLVYKNGELVQTLEAEVDPYSGGDNMVAYRVSGEDGLWRLECAAEDVIDIRFQCRDAYGLGYDFLFMTWVPGQDGVHSDGAAGFQSGSYELELFWE